MQLPSAGAMGKAVILTAVSIIVLNFVKPYLPTPIKNLLG